MLGFRVVGLSGPCPLSAHLGLYKRIRDRPANPNRHLKKERSDLSLKRLLKEDRGTRPTVAATADVVAARSCAAVVPAFTAAGSTAAAAVVLVALPHCTPCAHSPSTSHRCPALHGHRPHAFLHAPTPHILVHTSSSPSPNFRLPEAILALALPPPSLRHRLPPLVTTFTMPSAHPRPRVVIRLPSSPPSGLPLHPHRPALMPAYRPRPRSHGPCITPAPGNAPLPAPECAHAPPPTRTPALAWNTPLRPD